ncbi:hypothetical protein P3T27_002845 [Kitasatospora sp. MAA19]|uniref:hypothetical protein n=1 Tax=Kitasatospora sp. MAA19 TaxID=3035090 RepID=UPI002475B57E|nr:hypothetical protein [Kitasatospora sp. MAA19]MDH6706122.1 hypothetical protein [Kitasatospora sp. MAA19]
MTARSSRSRPNEKSGQWDDLSSFLQVYLNVETAVPYHLLGTRRTISSFPSHDALQRIFERMLAERTMPRSEFCLNTWIDFETDDDMYAYLTKVHAYLDKRERAAFDDTSHRVRDVVDQEQPLSRVTKSVPEDGVDLSGHRTSVSEDILGPEGHKRFTGFYKDPQDPSRYLPVDFEGGNIATFYEPDAHGKWHLVTSYANPAQGKHP